MTIKITANLSKGKLDAFGSTLNISCLIRNDINGWRKSSEVVYSIPDNKPVQPRQFPKGTWAVGKPDTKTDPYMAPFFIPTNAWQFLPIWEINDKKCYTKPTKNMIKDKGYGLHYSTSNTTHGCIKILSKDDLLWLVNQIRNHQSAGDVIMLEVV